MSSKRRAILQRLVSVMGAIAIVSFILVLLKGTLGFNPATGVSEKTNSDAEDVAAGETVLRRDQDGLIWFSHLNAVQLNVLKEFSDTLVVQDSGCETAVQFCVLSAETGQTGIQLRFIQSPPPQLPTRLPWSGGFVNPINGAVYDLLGRAYRFQGEVERLTVVEIRG